jgi:SAM-dependent methyltransferase
VTLSESVIWHDVECAGYAADLPLWRGLAEEAAGPVLDVGAGTGRVTLDLARAGHDVTALDNDGELLAELRRRAGDLPVHIVEADARDFHLGRRFGLIIVPMQTIQILGGPDGRERFLRCALAHLESGGLLVATVTSELLAFEAHEQIILPLPDLAEHGGWVYASQPIGVRGEPGATVIERLRVTVSPEGERREERNEVRLDTLEPAVLADEALRLGFEALPPRNIPETEEHEGSTVAVLRARRAARQVRTGRAPSV